MENGKVDLVGAFGGWKVGDWVWCLHCERCYQAGEFRLVEGLQLCPYEDCSGSTVADGWHWEQVAEGNGYPTVPERGKVYRLYP